MSIEAIRISIIYFYFDFNLNFHIFFSFLMIYAKEYNSYKLSIIHNNLYYTRHFYPLSYILKLFFILIYFIVISIQRQILIKI